MSKTKSKTMTERADVSSSSMRGEEAVDDTNTRVQLEDVLKANGEEHLLSQIMELAVHVEEDPPVIFGWQNVGAFLEAIEAAEAQAAAPGGLPLPANPLAFAGAVNEQTFKEAVLEYVLVPGAPARLGITCLPCSLAQSGQVAFMLPYLDLNPWTQRVKTMAVPNALPVVCVYVPRSNSNTLDSFVPRLPKSMFG
jgi:hypothetical protein